MTEATTRRLARRRQVLEELRALLVEALHLRTEPDAIDPDAPLFGTGLRLDSIDALELVVAVESRWGIQLVDEKGGAPLAVRTLNTIADRILAREAP